MTAFCTGALTLKHRAPWPKAHASPSTSHAGVPRFFRWLTERYPLTQEKLADVASVDIDNLYLDMNGIIHNCTHANEARVDATEEEMVRKCFLYIERLVRIAQPQKVLFMAIDGAPPGGRCLSDAHTPRPTCTC